MGRVNVVKYQGQTYRIPEMWFVARRQCGESILQAIEWWHEQVQMEQAFNAQQRKAA